MNDPATPPAESESEPAEASSAAPAPAPAPLEPIYRTEGPNDPVVLYDGDVRYREGNHIDAAGRGRVELSWIPSAQLRFTVEAEDAGTGSPMVLRHLPEKQDATLTLGDGGPTLPVGLAEWHSGFSVGFSANGWMKGKTLIGSGDGLTSLQFHLPNVRRWFGSPDSFCHRWETEAGQAARVVERLILVTNEWRIIIDPFELKREEHQDLRRIRGYGLTATGELRRTDGGSFSAKQAERPLETLSHLFVLALERWCAPLLLTGRDAAGEDRYHRWGVGRVSPYASHFGWYHDQLPGALKDLFAPLHEALGDEVRGPAFRNALYWYAEMHEHPVRLETSMILAAAALEMLGWSALVEVEQTVSEKAFKPLPAADKLSLLLTVCGVPTAVPPELSELRKIAVGRGWRGPDAVIELRNSLIHSHRKNRLKSEETGLKNDDVKWEAFRLAAWYLEMVLLNRLGYRGRYWDRVAGGQGTRPVPWAQPSTDSSSS